MRRQDELTPETDERTYRTEMLNETRSDERGEQPEPVDQDPGPVDTGRMDAEPVDTERGTEFDADRPEPADRPAQALDDEATLFPTDAVERFREEWQRIQTRFVDDPRDAVESADHLVDEVIRSLGEHKHELEGQWQQGSEAQTEDLRLALRRYRSFFNQLVNA